jgi:hypothetical protein
MFLDNKNLIALECIYYQRENKQKIDKERMEKEAKQKIIKRLSQKLNNKQ